MLFDQRSPVQPEVWFLGGDNIKHTDIATYRLNWLRGRSRENMKNSLNLNLSKMNENSERKDSIKILQQSFILDQKSY